MCMARPFCGNDGRVYKSMCQIKKASCHRQKWVIRADDEKCGLAGNDIFTPLLHMGMQKVKMGEFLPYLLKTTSAPMLETERPETFDKPELPEPEQPEKQPSTPKFNCNSCYPIGTEICQDNCQCFSNFTGEFCDACQNGHYGSKCQPCNCHQNNSIDQNCDSQGQCNCQENYTGQKCEISENWNFRGSQNLFSFWSIISFFFV